VKIVAIGMDTGLHGKKQLPVLVVEDIQRKSGDL